jgi:hypothetical protein
VFLVVAAVVAIWLGYCALQVLAVSEPCDPLQAALLERLEQNSQAKMRERDGYFHVNGSKKGETRRYRALLWKSAPPDATTLLSPYFPCLWSLQKAPSNMERWDGGKWVCGAREMGLAARTRKCVVYSFGSAGEDSFEKAIASTTHGKCDIHVFDPTSRPLSRWVFHPFGLHSFDGNLVIGTTTFPVKTIATIMRELAHQTLDILKFDVEGSEWDVINSTDWKSVRAGQLLFELHNFGGQDMRLMQIVSLFKKLEEGGYRLFSAEPVCYGCRAIEFGWIHREWTPNGFD